MNILFLTLLDFDSLKEHNIYADLLREFIKHHHRVFVISPIERRKKKNTYILKEENAVILKLKIGNMQKTNFIEKGVSTLLVESAFIKGIKKYFSKEHFNIVIYSTPPITLCKALDYVKKRDNAKTCLLLKDIFPQNAVDLGILTKKGIRGIIYRYFRNKERQLYRISDYIGCMSPANVEYVIKHNPDVDPDKVNVCPNSIEYIPKAISVESRKMVREKYGLPANKVIFVYGGNLGKPQGIDFLIQCLKTQKENYRVFFLLVGNGTEYWKLEEYIHQNKPQNVKLMKYLPKEDYDQLVCNCDVGMLFLDYRFTIPNFPSRLLSYMEAQIPVLAVTDSNTDVGSMVVDNGFGWWCESDSTGGFSDCLNDILGDNIEEKGIEGRNYLIDNYTVQHSYDIIMRNMGFECSEEEAKCLKIKRY